jgi:capsular polysaccharide biosynthesis protein
MGVLMKDVESAQRAYDTAAARFQQTNLESQASQTNVSILTRAFPPVDPSSPKIILNTLLSIFLGTLLGIGVALLMELLNRRVRSVQELALAAGVPVLGLLPEERVRAAAPKAKGKPTGGGTPAQASPTASAKPAKAAA